MDGLWIPILVFPIVVVAVALGLTLRRELVLALPFLAAINGTPLVVGGHPFRFDQLAAACLVAGLVPAMVARRRRLAMDAATWLLLLFAALNVLSTTLFSPAKGYSFTQILSLGTVWSLYVVLLNCLTHHEDLNGFIDAMLIAGVLESMCGVLAFLLGLADIPVGGANVGSAADMSLAFGAYGTLIEPNIFGSYCQAYFVLGVGLLWVAPGSLTRRRRLIVSILVVTSALGLLASFTRGAWLGTVCGLSALAILGARISSRRIPVGRIVVTAILIGGVLAGAAYLPGQVGEFIRYKLANLTSAQSQTAQSRLVTFGYAVLQWRDHPWIGCGTYTFAPLAVGVDANFRELGGRGLWISNFALLVLHDTGVVGLVLFLTLLGAVVVTGVRSARRLWAPAREDAAILVSLTATVIGLVVAFLFTTAFSVGYPWLFVGLIGAYAQYARRVSPPPAFAGAPAARRRRRIRPPPAGEAPAPSPTPIG